MLDPAFFSVTLQGFKLVLCTHGTVRVSTSLRLIRCCPPALPDPTTTNPLLEALHMLGGRGRGGLTFVKTTKGRRRVGIIGIMGHNLKRWSGLSRFSSEGGRKEPFLLLLPLLLQREKGKQAFVVVEKKAFVAFLFNPFCVLSVFYGKANPPEFSISPFLFPEISLVCLQSSFYLRQSHRRLRQS